eukprot:18294-Pelagomonas_calceolata.AAC.2
MLEEPGCKMRSFGKPPIFSQADDKRRLSFLNCSLATWVHIEQVQPSLCFSGLPALLLYWRAAFTRRPVMSYQMETRFSRIFALPGRGP